MAADRQPRKCKPGKRTTKNAAYELKLTLRQERACQLRLEGWTAREIAADLACSPSTVHSYIEAVLDRSKDASANAVEKQRRLSLARMDGAVRALNAKVAAGDSDAIRTLVMVEQRRAKLEGFDAADKTEISGPGGGPIAIEPRLALDAKLDELRKRIVGPEPGGDVGLGPAAAGEIPQHSH